MLKKVASHKFFAVNSLQDFAQLSHNLKDFSTCTFPDVSGKLNDVKIIFFLGRFQTSKLFDARRQRGHGIGHTERRKLGRQESDVRLKNDDVVWKSFDKFFPLFVNKRRIRNFGQNFETFRHQDDRIWIVSES